MGLFICMPAFAGVYEDALKSKDYVFLYIYTPYCRYCQIFSPKYNKLSGMYDKNMAFVKVDATQSYGNALAGKFNVNGVPYVVLVKSKTNSGVRVPSSCLLNIQCVENYIQKFMK